CRARPGRAGRRGPSRGASRRRRPTPPARRRRRARGPGPGRAAGRRSRGRCAGVAPAAAGRASWRPTSPSRGRRGRGTCRPSRLQDHRGGLAAGGADGDEAADGCARLGLLLGEQLGQGADDAPAGRAERVPGGERGAGDVEPVRGHRAERVAAEALPAELRVVPRGEGGEDGARERLVDLDEVEVREGEAAAVEEARDGVAAAHEEALGAAREVHGRRLGVDDAREGGQATLGGPLLGGEEDGRGPVGQRGRVAGRHRRVVAARCGEGGAELAELLQGGVRAEELVTGDAAVRGEEVVEEAAVVRRREVLVGGEGEGVLRLAGDAPPLDRKSTRLNSSHVKISYAVFCLKKKKT